MKQDLKSMTLAEMQDAFAAIGEPKFRAKQVFTWLHRGAVSFDAMTNLSKPLREKLDGLYYITAPSVARKQVSKLDGTIKYLWKLRDGNCVESVVMQYHHGNTVCISSEVGCPMGCKFCASTIGGSSGGSSRRSWSIRCSFPSSIPACRSPTSCSWASVSRWITSTTSCASSSSSTARTA